ncbi:MAG: tetratricopeptide repeat protein [Acidobacteriia bacterium]|nr:tetratricopeptide repeat protein [Terriglobia bacterium]
MIRSAIPYGFLLALMASAAGPPVTFNHDIAPIVYRKCAVCHRPGEAGPFPLLSYADIKKRAPQIAAVTRSGFMPPWLPEAGYGDFQDDRRLSTDEIRTIAEWVSQGAPEGAAAEAPAPPAFPEGSGLGPPDLVLEAPAAFRVPDSGPDLYWNFIFKPKVQSRQYVRALEILPGDRRLVHHANLLIDRTGSAHLREIAPGQGFPGMDLTVMRSPFDPDGHFLFWKPGSPARAEPKGRAWRLDPGDELVLNTHFHPTGKAEQARPSLALYFTDQRQTQFPLLLQLENDRALDIPPGASNFMISDDFRLPMDVDALAVYPHAHSLGKLLEAYATLPDGSRRWLIRIPDWDPNWQAVFEYREPVFLPKGTTISMRYHYDNSAANIRNPSHPPRRVRGGNQATDEMGHLWLQVLPRGAGDRRRELQEAFLRHRLEKDPDNFEANFNLGAVMLSRLNAQEAVGMLRAAVRTMPNRADARNMLGTSLETTGRSAEAVQQFREALQMQPDYASARFNLANALAKAGQLEDAVTNYRQVAEALPSDPLPRTRLAEALLRLGKRDEAMEQFRRVLEIDPTNQEAKDSLGK